MQNVFYEARKDTRGKLFAELQKQYPGRLHFHRAFEIAYILEGAANYTVENESFVDRSTKNRRRYISTYGRKGKRGR